MVVADTMVEGYRQDGLASNSHGKVKIRKLFFSINAAGRRLLWCATLVLSKEPQFGLTKHKTVLAQGYLSRRKSLSTITNFPHVGTRQARFERMVSSSSRADGGRHIQYSHAEIYASIPFVMTGFHPV